MTRTCTQSVIVATVVSALLAVPITYLLVFALFYRPSMSSAMPVAALAGDALFVVPWGVALALPLALSQAILWLWYRHRSQGEPNLLFSTSLSLATGAVLLTIQFAPRGTHIMRLEVSRMLIILTAFFILLSPAIAATFRFIMRRGSAV